MSTPFKPVPALLFTAVLISKDFNLNELVEILEKEFGKISVYSRKIKFIWSDYYEAEMGPELERVFMVFEDLVSKDEIIRVKRITDEIENKYSNNGKRTVNIDPGLIALENIVLATNKAFFHRVYLGDGVYAEVTLYYKGKTYWPIEYWTFPEYRSTPVISFFNQVRQELKRQVVK